MKSGVRSEVEVPIAESENRISYHLTLNVFSYPIAMSSAQSYVTSTL